MDGNAQNMFHGNHQGEPYYRYDPTAAAAAAAAATPRAMGPPGAYPPRHRAPHPLQQQSQYPTYQPTPDNIYGLTGTDQHSLGMGDLSGWGAASSQTGAYPASGMGAYGHPQVPPPTQQRQPTSQPSYRQHMPSYGQQDQQKLSYASQQMGIGSLLQQPGTSVGSAGYGTLTQAQQPQQQQATTSQQQQQPNQQTRLPQHYPQAPTQHPLYPVAPTSTGQTGSSVSVPGGPQAYTHSPYGNSMQHQSGRAVQHIPYGHLDQTNPYGQHVPTSAAPTSVPTHHLTAQQQQAGQLGAHMGPGSQQQQQQPSTGLPHSSNNVVSQPSLPSSLGAAQQQQSTTHIMQNQQQPQQIQQQSQQQQQPNHVGLIQPPSQHQQLPGAVLPPPHTLGVPPSYSSHHQQQQQQQQQNQQQPNNVQSVQSAAASYLSSSKHQTTSSQLSSSPQYRAPFPQLSPQMSPRPITMSPHPQMSPRPGISPAKPPPQPQAQAQQQVNPPIQQQSTHHSISGMVGLTSPRPQVPNTGPPSSKAGGGPPVVNTLQALEQMVMPTQGVMSGPGGVPMDYPPAYRQTPSHAAMSPMGPRMPVSPQHHLQWSPHLSLPQSQNPTPLSVSSVMSSQPQLQHQQQQMNLYAQVQGMTHQQQAAGHPSPIGAPQQQPPPPQQQTPVPQPQSQHQQLNDQLQHSINDIVGGGQQQQHHQQQQLPAMSPINTQQQQHQQAPPSSHQQNQPQQLHHQPPGLPNVHHMGHHQLPPSTDHTTASLMSRNTPTHDPTVGVVPTSQAQQPSHVQSQLQQQPSPHQQQQSPLQQSMLQQQSPRRHQQLSPHNPPTQQQQLHQPYPQQHGQQLLGDPFAAMLTATQDPSTGMQPGIQQQTSQLESQSSLTQTPQPQSQSQQQSLILQQQTAQLQQRDLQQPSSQSVMSPAHVSPPLASTPNVVAQQPQHQSLSIQQQQPPQQPPTPTSTPTSTPSHHLTSILNETANSNDSSTLAVAANDSNNSNNSSSNSSTNSIVNNQPTSVHDSNSQSSINSSNHQQQSLSGIDSIGNAVLNNNSNSATTGHGGLLDSAGANLFDNTSMSSTSAAIAAASSAASAAAAMLDSNSQSSFISAAACVNDFDSSSKLQQQNPENKSNLGDTPPEQRAVEIASTEHSIDNAFKGNDPADEVMKPIAEETVDGKTSTSPAEMLEETTKPADTTSSDTILEQAKCSEETLSATESESQQMIPLPQQTHLQPQQHSVPTTLVDSVAQMAVGQNVTTATSNAPPQSHTHITPMLPPNLLPHHPMANTPGMTAMGYDGTPQMMLPPYAQHVPPASHMYPPYPMVHQQEIAALQQQLQEMYCMPPTGPDHQEKIVRLQERLNMLQQHEVNDQCAGNGPQCILYQSGGMPPIYGSSVLHSQMMVESPQVSSTTGRGRGKGTTKPRKPRAKKGEKAAAQQAQQPSSDIMDISCNIVPSHAIPTTHLPVSEDCVTQGAGDKSVVGILEYNEGSGDHSQDIVHSANDLDTSTDDAGKKKKPRKPRAPKDPNKPPRDRTPKAKKVKDGEQNCSESLASIRRRNGAKKKKNGEEEEKAADGSEAEDNKPLSVCKSNAAELGGNATSDNSESPIKPETTTSDEPGTEIKSTNIDGEAPDYDDIPVSKIPTTRANVDDEKSTEAGDETVDSVPDSAGDATTTPSRRSKKRSGGRNRGNNSDDATYTTRRRCTLSARALKKRRNRGRIVPESDGEDDTLASTPPPSPPPDSETDKNKRRSSRNTQRKKYIDDVMLRFSDDDSSLMASPVKKEKKGSAAVAIAAAAAAAPQSCDAEKADASAASSGAEGETGGSYDKPTACEAEDGTATEASSSTATEKDKSLLEAPPPISSKPNYVYINTGDEDSMVVQYVLAVRMGRRELIPDPPPAPPKKHERENKENEDNVHKSDEKSEVTHKERATEEIIEDKKDCTEENEIGVDEAEKESEITGGIQENVAHEKEPVKMDADKNEQTKSVVKFNDDAQKSNEHENVDSKNQSEEDLPSKGVESKGNGNENVSDSLKIAVINKSDDSKIVDLTETQSDKVVKNEKDNIGEVGNMDVDVESKAEADELAVKVSEDNRIYPIDGVRVSVSEKDTTINEENVEGDNKDRKEDSKVKSYNQNNNEKKDKNSNDVDSSFTKPEPVYIDVEEFFVKYRNFSYLHCEWRTEEELFKGDRRVTAKIRRFQQKQAQQINIFDSIEEEPFNPDFVEVDRVLDMSVHTDENTRETTKHYLVKWKSLPYEDCTWELEEDVDADKIEQYMRFNKLPLRAEWKNKKRPHPEQWKKLENTPLYKGGNTLRPYQLEGLNWLKFSWYNSHNCILADEMGLGKTIQSLTFVHSVYEYGIRGPFLVIAPLSTIPNWQREFESWTNMNVVVYHGSVTSKQMIQDYEFYYKTESGKVLKEPVKFNVLITTFEMIVTDHMDLKSFNWRLCVIDEAHRLKNRNCKLLEGLRQLNLEHRVLLSGTPLQNNISELFSLLNFLEPNQFSCPEEFMSEFGSLRTEEEVNKLQALLKPMMLRRLKDDVEKSLAPKEETIIEVELTNIQKKYYRGILEQNFSFLKKGTTSANIPNLMNTMMELRKCCIHPYLLNGAEEQIQYDFRVQHGDDPESYYKNLIQSAGKMVLIDKLLPKLKANGHRVLIFSQMVRCLDILEDYLMYRKYPFERIDGRIRGNLRQEAIDRYSKPGSDRFVFLLCTKAGGLGINLTAADTVIIYDSDWNPQNDLQAQARCHRIGQRKMVKIYRLLCRNTYEREMFDKASLKLGLDKAVLQSMNTHNSKDGSNRQLSKKEIEDLLRKGAYGAVMDDDNAGDKFCEEDIDSILKRRTQVITMESEKGSTFSKASFAASGNRSDIKIDDPDFWTKWAKKADIDPDACERDETEDLVLSEPRRRTQIKRYGHEDVMEINSDDSSNENSDEEGGISLRSRRRKEKRMREREREKKTSINDEYIPRERDALASLGLDEIQYGNWAKSECFKVEKGLLSFGWGRWPEILELGQFKRGWREMDVEDCARIILLYCLQVYKGDEKIKNFIWDLITPTEDGEVQKISRDHSGLHNLVPRGRNAKGRNGGKAQKEMANAAAITAKADVDRDVGGNISATTSAVASPTDASTTSTNASTPISTSNPNASASQNALNDPNHWSKQEKFDADTFLECAYKKHLSRHANKVLLRVRMLYYIQHEVIGDLVQQIKDNTPVSELPIRPPATPDQVPASWWNPACCDKSLLVGTYKHGCEMYRQIRADPNLCFVGHVGAGDDMTASNLATNEDDAISKHEDAEEIDDDGTITKDSDSTKTGDNKDLLDPERPGSSGKSRIRAKSEAADVGSAAAANSVATVDGTAGIANKDQANETQTLNEPDEIQTNFKGLQSSKNSENPDKSKKSEASEQKSNVTKDADASVEKAENELTTVATDIVSSSTPTEVKMATVAMDMDEMVANVKSEADVDATTTTVANAGGDSTSADTTVLSASVSFTKSEDGFTKSTSARSEADCEMNSENETETAQSMPVGAIDSAIATDTNTTATEYAATSTSPVATDYIPTLIPTSNTNEQTQNDTLNSTTIGLDEEESVASSYPPTTMAADDATMWPSMQDLNTRLRRVITAYQRNYKKEELKQQQKAKLQAMVSSTPPLSVPTTPTLQSMQNAAASAAGGGGSVNSGGNSLLQQSNTIEPGNRSLQSLQQNTSIPTASGGVGSGRQTPQQLSTSPSTSAAAAAAAAVVSTVSNVVNVPNICPAMINGSSQHQTQQLQHPPHTPQQQQQQQQQQHAKQQQQQQQHIVAHQQQQQAAAATVAPQMPTAADIGLMLSFLNTTDVSHLANLDLNKLAMYLKIERQGKLELAAKERENQRLQQIPKKWNRREEYEFLRVLTGYGVDLQPSTSLGLVLASDWTKFKQMAHLERKSDETLSDYYKVFIAMCKRKAGVKLNDNERGLEGIFEEISEDHAKLILERLELLSKLREIARHPQLEERLKLCQKNPDTPDWWEPGRHDKELISAVLKHGLYRSETFIFNDPNFSFAESEKRFIRELEAQIQRSIKLESFHADRLPSSIPNVRGEVIDLDDELLTKDSLIKKEQFMPLKTEVKSEVSADGADKLSVGKTEADNETCVVSEETKNKNNDEKSDTNADLSSSKEITDPNTECTGIDSVHELQDEDIKTFNASTDDEINSMQTFENMPKDENEKIDIDGSFIIKKDLDASTAVLDNENYNDMSTSNDVGDGITSTSAKASETAENAEEIQPDKMELNEKEILGKDDKPSCLVIENNKKESGDKADHKEDVINKDSVIISNIEDSRSISSKIEQTIPQNEGAGASSSDEKPKSTADEEILDLAIDATGVADPDDEDIMKEKENSVEEECKKQAAELKARFPDLEVIQPATVKQKQDKPKLEMCMIRWFKDFALERRISHIVICVETNKWPVNRNYTAFVGCKGIDLNICLHEAIPHLKNFERPPSTTDVITITTEQGVSKNLQASQMPLIVPSSTPSIPITTPPAIGANIGMSLLTPPANVAGGDGTGKDIVNVVTPPLDSNSINLAVTAAVAATASGGNNANALSASTLSALLPGMTMTPSSAAAVTALTNSPVVPPRANISSSVSTLTPAAQTTGKKRKRHIAIDVETERAKLHALLNSSQNMGLKDWENEIANMEPPAASPQPTGRRSASSASPVAPTASATNTPLQPPPAHQHASLQRQSSSQFSKPAVPPLKTPPTSIGAPMDLSSSLPRVNMADMLKSASGAIDLSEVQDFSMSSKKAPTSHLQASLNSAFPSMLGKGKLDDTLNKLMKKNNCTIEEPVIGKEKKRKKLDEIVLGLSAAKEQKTFPDPSLPSSKKPQIPPSVSVTPASLQTSVSSQNQQIQKPFTITVTTVPGKSKSGGNTSMPSPAPVASPLSSGLPLMSGGLSLKDINAIVAQTMASDPQTLLKQQQKMMQCLPPAQRKAYEAMLAEMEQAMKLSAKYNVPDLKVNKWLTDMSTPLSDQLNMDFSPVASTSSNTNNRRSNRQQSSNSGHQSSVSQLNKAAAGQSAQQSHAHHQQQQQQPAMAGPQGLTGEEPVPVVNKQTGKRISGSKAPQLKRLMQWLTENPAYEVDPKWLEQIQNPMSIPSPKLSSMDTSNYALSSKTTHGGRPSSTTSSSSSGAHTQQQQSSSAQSSPAPSPTVSSKKSSRQSAIDQANAAMQFGSLAGLNPNLLASLPSLGAFDPKNALGAFDPKNPLLSMPFAGMPGMSNIPGLNNLNSMNLFASLASMGGLGNLATMDPQTLAALMAAGSALAGLGNTNPSPGSSSTGKNSQSGGSSSKKNKNDAQQNAMMNLGALASNTGSSGSTGNGTGNSSNKNANAAAASQLTGCFPYLFPNPSLLYPPMGLGGLNPYSLGSAGLGSAYDQLAQQYNLLNGGTGVTSSAGSSSTTQSKSHQSQSKSSNSRASTSSSPSAASVANLMNAMASIGAAGQPTTSVSSSQSSSRSSGRQSAASRAAAQVAEMAQLSSLLLPGTDPHLLESLSRMDLAQSTRLLSSLGIPPITATAPQLSSSDKRSSNSNSAASIAAAQAAQAEKQAAKEQQKWMESLARSQLPTDLATLQAFSQSKFPASLSGGSQSTSTSSSASTSSASTSKNASKAAAAALAAQLPQILGLPSDFAPAMIADMAQALTAPGSLASLAGLTMPPTSSASSIGGSSSSSSSKRQRGGSGGGNSSNMLDPDALTKDAFKQQMEYYTKTLGLGSGISLIPTSSMSSSGVTNSISNAQIDEHHKSKRSRLDSHAAALANAKDELSAAMLASGLPLNLGGGMASMEKSLRGVNVGMGGNGGATMPEADKVTLTPLNSAGIAANLPSQTTITIAPPISSGASSSSERSERSESRISLTITNAADAAKLPPPYEEADELIIQPILKKPQNIPTSAAPSAASSSHGSVEDLEAAVATNMGGGATSVNTTPTPSTSAAAAAAAAVASANEEHRRSSSRLKRPRTGADHSGNEQPPEKRRELRSTRHTRQSSGSLETTLNLSTNNEAEEKNE